MRSLLLVFLVFNFGNVWAQEKSAADPVYATESDENVELSLDQESLDEMQKNAAAETASGSLPEMTEQEENELTLSNDDIDPALQPTRNHASDSSTPASKIVDSAASAEAANEIAKPAPQATTDQILVEKGLTDTTAKKVLETATTQDSTQGVAIELGEVKGTQKYKITCVLNDDVREITAITQADGSVGIVYKKFDSIKTIAIAKKDSPYADQVADKIQNNLANGTYPYACTKE